MVKLREDMAYLAYKGFKAGASMAGILCGLIGGTLAFAGFIIICAPWALLIIKWYLNQIATWFPSLDF